MSDKLDEIDKKILKFIEKSDWPVTTEQVAEGAGVSWNTAQIHLYKIQVMKKIKGKRVGRQNQWMRTN